MTSKTLRYAIIVAGGKGLQMGADIPKQFLPVSGKPVLIRTISRSHAYGKDLKVILVLPKEQQTYWKGLCEQYHPDEEHQLADGGASRFQSCRNDILMIPTDAIGLISIHNGVRPFVSCETITRCFDTVQTSKAVIPVLPVADTLHFIGDSPSGRNAQRSNYKVVQTPQVFDIQLIKKAYEQEGSAGFTDDMSVVERLGQVVTIMEGNRENIKITTPFDLKVAEALLIHNS